MRKIRNVFLALVLCLAAVLPTVANADSFSARLVDDADLLTIVEEEVLCSKLDSISEKWQVDVVVVTANQLHGATPQDFSDTLYAGSEYRKDSILLLVSMEERDLIVTPYHGAQDSFTNAGCEYILDQIAEDMSSELYMLAFDEFAQLCDEFMNQAQTGEAYAQGNLPKGPFPLVKRLLIAVAIGLVVALIVTGVMKSQLKSVHSQSAADTYVKSGSLNITHKQDLFLYRNVTRKPKPKGNSGGRSGGSSGGGRAGASRKF